MTDHSYNALICRYNEIATKSGNRSMFEGMLCNSLRRRLTPRLGELKFVFEHGRIFVLPNDDRVFDVDLTDAVLRAEIPGIAGIASMSPGYLFPATMENLEKCIQDHFDDAYRRARRGRNIATYAMRVRRVTKDFPMRSEEIERHFADTVLERYPELSISLRHSDFTVEVEIRNEAHCFVCFERINGPGGLPVGSSGRVLALLSGGFDSPVACYELMRRGCTVDFITFHSSPFTPPATTTKVCSIVRQLNQFQKRSRFVSINLLPMQEAVKDTCRSKFRTVLYRRFMVRIADALADYFGDEALATGDNLGQVASQTLTNMGTINQAASRLILRPLLTFDKLDIIAIAEKIGTADISKVQVPDSCTVFAPQSPSTHADLEPVLEDEALLDVNGLVAACLESAVLVNARTLTEHEFPELAARFRKSRGMTEG